MKKLFIIVPVLFCLLAPVAKADNVWEMAESPSYGRKAGGMLGRGLVNIATCFVDIIVSTVEGTKSGPPFVGTITGLGKGIGCGALRVLSGALDVTTFWVPGFNGFAVCRSYADCTNCNGTQAAPAYQPPPQQPMYAQPVQAAQPQPVRDESPMRYVKK